jgi:hypothetical protein
MHHRVLQARVWRVGLSKENVATHAISRQAPEVENLVERRGLRPNHDSCTAIPAAAEVPVSFALPRRPVRATSLDPRPAIMKPAPQRVADPSHVALAHQMPCPLVRPLHIPPHRGREIARSQSDTAYDIRVLHSG